MSSSSPSNWWARQSSPRLPKLPSTTWISGCPEFDSPNRSCSFTSAWSREAISGRPEIASRDHALVKEQLLFGLSNSGQPLIQVVDGNFGNRGELCLAHQFEGLELDMRYASETMKHLEALWGRPVHVESKLDGKGVLVS